MTAAEYLERIRNAPTSAEAYAVTREAIVDAEAGKITVQEWNEIYIAADKRCRPARYRERTFTGD